MHKKGYFLTIDAFVAIGVIVIGIIIVLSQYSFKPYEPQYSSYSRDLMNSLSSTQIYKINDDGYPYLKQYKNSSNITNMDNTVYEQLAEFVLRADYGCVPDCMHMAENLTREITNKSIAPQYSYTIRLYNSTDGYLLYNRTFINPFGEENKMSKSSYVASSKGIVSAVYEDHLAVYVTEVVVWQ